MPTPDSRRQFLRIFGLSIVAAALSRFIPQALGAPAKDEPLPAGMKEVAATDPVANAIGYKGDVKQLDYKKYPARKDPKNKNQFCENCALYTKVNGSWGKCQMLVNGLVRSKGWCGSYSKTVGR